MERARLANPPENADGFEELEAQPAVDRYQQYHAIVDRLEEELHAGSGHPNSRGSSAGFRSALRAGPLIAT